MGLLVGERDSWYPVNTAREGGINDHPSLIFIRPAVRRYDVGGPFDAFRAAVADSLDTAFDRATAWIDARYDALRFALRSPLDYRVARMAYRAARPVYRAAGAIARRLHDVLWSDVNDCDWVWGICLIVIFGGLIYVGSCAGAFLRTGAMH